MVLETLISSYQKIDHASLFIPGDLGRDDDLKKILVLVLWSYKSTTSVGSLRDGQARRIQRRLFDATEEHVVLNDVWGCVLAVQIFYLATTDESQF